MDFRSVLNQLDNLNTLTEAAPSKFEPTHFHKSNLFGLKSDLMLHSDGNFYHKKDGGIERWHGNVNNRSSVNPASVDGEYVDGKAVDYPEGVTFADKQKETEKKSDLPELELDKDGNPIFPPGVTQGTVDGVGVTKPEKTAAELEKADYEAEMELYKDAEKAKDAEKKEEPEKKEKTKEIQSVTLSDGSKFTKDDEKQIYAKVQDIIAKADALLKQANLKESILSLVDESFVVEGISQADKIQLQQYIDDLKKLSGANFVANTIKDVINKSVKDYEDKLASPEANKKSGSLQAFLNSGKKGLADEQGEESTVEELQKMLIDLGYDVGDKGADGIYGSDTAKAVREFQKKAGLAVDGDAGPSTIAMLLNPGDKDVSKDGKKEEPEKKEEEPKPEEKKEEEPKPEEKKEEPKPEEKKEEEPKPNSAENNFGYGNDPQGEFGSGDLKPADKVLSPEDEAELAAKYDADAKEAEKELDAIKKNAGIDAEKEKEEEKPEIDTDSAATSSAGGDLMKRAYDNVLKIRDAVDGAGTDENAVYKVLGSVENDIEWAAMNIIDPNLSKAIANDMSGFMGMEMIKAKEILAKKDISWKPSSGAAVPDGAIRAFRLNRAFDGFGTDNDEVFAVIDEIRSKAEWDEVKEFFPNVDDELSSELSGTEEDQVRGKLSKVGVNVKVDSFVKDTKPEDKQSRIDSIKQRINGLKESAIVETSFKPQVILDNRSDLRRYVDIISEKKAVVTAVAKILSKAAPLGKRMLNTLKWFAKPGFVTKTEEKTFGQLTGLYAKRYLYYTFMGSTGYSLAVNSSVWESELSEYSEVLKDLIVMKQNGDFDGDVKEYIALLTELETKIDLADKKAKEEFVTYLGRAVADGVTYTLKPALIIAEVSKDFANGFGREISDLAGTDEAIVEKARVRAVEDFDKALRVDSSTMSTDSDNTDTSSTGKSSTDTSSTGKSSTDTSSTDTRSDKLKELEKLYNNKAAMDYLKSSDLEGYKKVLKVLGKTDELAELDK